MKNNDFLELKEREFCEKYQCDNLDDIIRKQQKILANLRGEN